MFAKNIVFIFAFRKNQNMQKMAHCSVKQSGPSLVVAGAYVTFENFKSNIHISKSIACYLLTDFSNPFSHFKNRYIYNIIVRNIQDALRHWGKTYQF